VFDTETTGLKYEATSIDEEFQMTGISMWDWHNDPVFIEINFTATVNKKEQDPDNKRKKINVKYNYKHTKGIDWEVAKPYIVKILDGAQVTAHNGKFDYKVAKKYGFNVFNLLHDTMIMAYLIDVNAPKGLKDNSKRYLKETMTELDEIIDVKNPDWFNVNFDEYGRYACADAFNTGRLEEVFLPILERKQLMNTYRVIEMPIIIPIAEMEMRGVKINPKILFDLSKQLHADKEELAKEIYAAAGCEFNIGSNKQLAEVLFDRLGYPCISTTDKGARSVDDATLKELSYRGYDVADLISDYNKLEKLLNTYVDKIPLLLDRDNRLHGNFNQTGARTGRFSSSDPNLQNQPKSDKRVRSAFIADEGRKLLVLDWSTIEIRIMAHESRDAVLTKLLWEGADLHQATADSVSKLVGLSLSRQQGKTLNFAILYGMGGDSLAYTLNAELKKKVRKGEITQEEYKKQAITVEQAEKIIDGYYIAYSGFADWSQREINKVKANDFYVRTLGGRIRQVNELKNRKTYGSGCRIVINTKIQGGAGDLMKLAIQQIDNAFKELGLDAHLLLVVHDEYVIDASDADYKEAYRVVEDIMVNIFPNCRVPIACDGGAYDNWAKIGKDYMKKQPLKKVAPIWQKNRVSQRRLIAQ